MAEYKLYNLKDPKTGQEEPQISSKEEFDAIKQKVPTSNIKNPRTGQEGSAESVVKEDEIPSQESPKQADAVNVAKEIAKVLKDALKEHGDEMQGIFLKDLNTRGCTVKITYKPDEQGQQTEDEFVFRWDNGSIRLDNVANPVDLGQIHNQSGRSTIQKDILKDRLLAFLDSHDEPTEQPSDPAEIPDGQQLAEEENLWESEECQNAFCDAVQGYLRAKDKDSIKQLLKSCRPYRKGNTIQEKLKGAVDWYNWFTENPPKNTKKQVFLEKEEDPEDKELFTTVIKPLFEVLKTFKDLVNRTANTHLGSYYRSIAEAAERLYRQYYLQWGEETNPIHEFMDLDDPIAQGYEKDPNNYFEPKREFEPEEEDEPVLGEMDEFGPEVGDEVEYGGGNYKLYGYCGYEVVLQNVDDERDFKIVKPVEIGIGAKSDLKETDFVSPEELPEN